MEDGFSFVNDLSQNTSETSKLEINTHQVENSDTKNGSKIILKSLKGFRAKRMLSECEETKSIFIEGSFDGKEGIAVLLLEKKPFLKDTLNRLLSEDTKLAYSFHNDVYYSYNGFPEPSVNGIKATVIYPATEKHVQKYEFQTLFIVRETPELYNTVVLPYLGAQQFSLAWIDNILDHKEEQHRVIYEDPDPHIGFILMPDLKWDEKNMECLHVLALCRAKGVKSLRDLTSDHIPLLENIRKKSVAVISDKYKIPECHLRVFIHYQPSYYHFHVHFTSVQHLPPGTQVEKAHLLDTVIHNLTLFPDYYKQIILSYTVKENDPLYKKLKEAGGI